jgi:hypothetical protein
LDNVWFAECLLPPARQQGRLPHKTDPVVLWGTRLACRVGVWFSIEHRGMRATKIPQRNLLAWEGAAYTGARG